MKRLILSALALSLAGGAFAMGRTPPREGAAPTKKDEPAKKEAPMEKSTDITATASPSVWKGPHSGINDLTAFVIEDPSNWEKVWKDYMKREVPKVDFTKHFAACVFLGLRPTGGFGVDFLSPLMDAGTVTIRYRIHAPGGGSFVTQAFTTPFAVQLYKKTGRAVKLVEEKK
ncbi:MAG: protease complex subunit PrcB family protein [Elusimicrobiota bacterium]|jgi:hypothetical protein